MRLIDPVKSSYDLKNEIMLICETHLFLACDQLRLGQAVGCVTRVECMHAG